MNPSEIPGFYFDVKQNRYFALPLDNAKKEEKRIQKCFSNNENVKNICISQINQKSVIDLKNEQNLFNVYPANIQKLNPSLQLENIRILSLKIDTNDLRKESSCFGLEKEDFNENKVNSNHSFKNQLSLLKALAVQQTQNVLQYLVISQEGLIISDVNTKLSLDMPIKSKFIYNYNVFITMDYLGYINILNSYGNLILDCNINEMIQGNKKILPSMIKIKEKHILIMASNSKQILIIKIQELLQKKTLSSVKIKKHCFNNLIRDVDYDELAHRIFIIFSKNRLEVYAVFDDCTSLVYKKKINDVIKIIIDQQTAVEGSEQQPTFGILRYSGNNFTLFQYDPLEDKLNTAFRSKNIRIDSEASLSHIYKLRNKNEYLICLNFPAFMLVCKIFTKSFSLKSTTKVNAIIKQNKFDKPSKIILI